MQRNDPPTITYSTLHTGAGIVETLPLMGTEDDLNGVNIEHLIVYDEEVAANPTGKYSKRKRACIAYMESTVVWHFYNYSLSFKPVALYFSRISSL